MSVSKNIDKSTQQTYLLHKNMYYHLEKGVVEKQFYIPRIGNTIKLPDT